VTIHVFGGGTVNFVRNHLALCAPAYGQTARALARRFKAKGYATELHLTRMADRHSPLESNADVAKRLEEVLASRQTRLIIFNVALCDFNGTIGDVPSGKYATRLKTREVGPDGLALQLTPADKLLHRIHVVRPDVLTVGFKTTAGEAPAEQLQRAQALAVEHHLTWVLANDTVTRHNIVYLHDMANRANAVRCHTTSRTTALSALFQACTEALHV